MEANRSVALVGRPNVGKSRLFNRLVGRRIAIVHDMPGVTRDLAMAEVGDSYLLMDTGGIGMKPEMTPEAIHSATEEQVDFALQAAAVVLFVMEGPEGVTPVDQELTDKLRRYGKKVIVVANKMDRRADQAALGDFHQLGFDGVAYVSAEHGSGCDELHRAIMAILGPVPAPTPEQKAASLEKRTRICLCGRPNVGKSSLGNALLKAPRLIVSDISGTTRDAIEHSLDYTDKSGQDWHFTLVDTAGMKPNRKLGSSLDYFSNLRSQSAIESSDVAFLILDATTGVTKHDKKIAGEIMEAGIGLAVVVNKWDLALQLFREDPISGYENEKDFRRKFIDAVREELFFLPDSPVIFTSALSGYQVETILQTAVSIDTTQSMKLPTGKVNQTVRDLLERQQARVVGGKRWKAYYAVQVGNRPFRIRLFCNRAEKLEDSYERYLQNGFQEAFRLDGCPVRFELMGKPEENPYYKPSDTLNKGRNALTKHLGGVRTGRGTGKSKSRSVSAGTMGKLEDEFAPNAPSGGAGARRSNAAAGRKAPAGKAPVGSAKRSTGGASTSGSGARKGKAGSFKDKGSATSGGSKARGSAAPLAGKARDGSATSTGRKSAGGAQSKRATAPARGKKAPGTNAASKAKGTKGKSPRR